MSTLNDNLLEEIPAILARAGRALSTREILAHCDGLADGIASLMKPLNELCRDGTLVLDSAEWDIGGPRRYRLASVTPAPAAPAPAPVAEPPAAPVRIRSAPSATHGGATPKITRALAVLADGETHHRREIATQLDMDIDRVSDLLWKLARRGLVEKLERGFWRAVSAGNAPPQPAPAPRKKPHVPSERETAVRHDPARSPAAGEDLHALKSLIRRHIDPPVPPPAPPSIAMPIMAWRSDGVVELRRTDAVIEITAAELAALTQFAARFAGQDMPHD